MNEQKKKIVYVITKSNWGGAQRYVFDLATSLPQNEFEVEVALGGNGLLKEKLTGSNIKMISIPELQRDVSFLNEIHSFFSLYKIFRGGRPDIIHLNSSKAAGLGVLAARAYSLLRITPARLNIRSGGDKARPTEHSFGRGLKIIFTVHGWPFNEKRSWLWKSLTWLASYVTALLSTDIVVIASPDFEQAKAMPGIITKTHLIPNGIKMPEYLSRDEARRKLKLGQNTLVVGSIGELTWNKNYPELVMVAEKLLRKHLDFELALIGEGEDRAEITTYKKNRPVFDGRIILEGFKEDACTYLKAFDIFVLNSRKEGLPYVVLEAGAAGLPVAATSVGGVPDIIENDKTGLLAPPYRMGEALQKLLTEKEAREKLGQALKERVANAFSFERMFAETRKLYKPKLS